MKEDIYVLKIIRKIENPDYKESDNIDYILSDL